MGRRSIRGDEPSPPWSLDIFHVSLSFTSSLTLSRIVAGPMQAHEKLQVYAKAVKFAAQAIAFCSNWDKKHALVDHLFRASESIVLNLAEAARQQGNRGRLTTLDYAIGSSLECAACFDLAGIKQLVTKAQCYGEKQRLGEVTKMLIGLRKAWDHALLKEEAVPYQISDSEVLPPLFHHESLDVYQAGLSLVEWFETEMARPALSNRLFRQLDASATSMVLNIAEGNGRYAHLDHRRFLHVAQSAVVKSAAYLDLCSAQAVGFETITPTGKRILDRVAAMLAGMEQESTK